MKILKYELVGEMIHLLTDNTGSPNFTYFKDKFKNLKEVEAEINKSIFLAVQRKLQKNKVSVLVDSLVAGGVTLA